MKNTRNYIVSFLCGALACLCMGYSLLPDGIVVGAGNARISAILTGSATLDFGTNFVESVETLQISVPGAVVGNAVALGCPLDIAGSRNGDFYAFASNDVVYVRAVHNIAASNWDPLAGVYTVIVFK